jgi:hypothetical protein
MSDLENPSKKPPMTFIFWMIFYQLKGRHSKNPTNDRTENNENNEERISKDYQKMSVISVMQQKVNL